jgi:hypothetical protein
MSSLPLQMALPIFFSDLDNYLMSFLQYERQKMKIKMAMKMENKFCENVRRNLINCHLSMQGFMTELYFRNENEEKYD